MKLSILIPVFNEMYCLEEFCKRLLDTFERTSAEYIFINDGSTDGSKEWLLNFSKKTYNNDIKVINIEKNIGKGNALHNGMKEASGDYFLFQDADLELDTNDSMEMFNIITNDKSISCLFGSRYLSGKLKKNNNYLNEFIGKFNSLLFNILFRQSLSDLHCGVKIIRKSVFSEIKLTIKDFGFEIDIASQISKKNYDIYEYGVSYFSRSKKEGKKITWVDGLKSYYYLFKTRFLQNDLLTISSIFFSTGYMVYVGTFFGMGLGKNMVVVLFTIVGLFIGLYRNVVSSSLIFFCIYLGSLFSKGNGKIYTILLFFIIGLYLSKKFDLLMKKNN